jgi:MoxR-like ATPase
MATQNPIEQEGTYPLPEAQLDRFLLHVRVDYPDLDTEKAILALNRAAALDAESAASPRRMSQTQIFAARRAVLGVFMAPQLEDYLVHLVMATREPGRYNAALEGWLRFGASPRATLALDRCARALAWLDGRDFITPEDIQHIAPDCLRHRLLLDYEAEAEGRSVDAFIDLLLARVPVP